METAGTIWDPLRKRDVALTPEEEVRQWFIGVLRDCLQVPEHLMMSEVQMRYGAARKLYRADILIYDRDAAPLAVVECKRREVSLSKEVLEQALRYDCALGVKYIFITNGTSTIAARRTPQGLEYLREAPVYSEMTKV